VTFEDAQSLQIKGRYSEVLRHALAGQGRASAEGRTADEIRWTLFAAKACRFIGRTAEGLALAGRAVELAAKAGDPELRAQALHAQAVCLRCARRYDEALDALRRAREEAVSDLTAAAVHLETAETALEAGLRPEAEAALARGGALVQWVREPRLLAWTLYLRSHFEQVSPADLQLAAAYEIARTVDCPELQWQILWRLADRAGQYGQQQAQDDLISNALMLLARLAEPLEAADATAFWRMGARRAFVDQVQKRYGAQFLQKIMLGESPLPAQTDSLLQSLGFNPSSIPDFTRKDAAAEE
jgi:hypothetical protein